MEMEMEMEELEIARAMVAWGIADVSNLVCL